MTAAALRSEGPSDRPSPELLYRALVATLTDMMVLLDPEGQIVSANQASIDVLGFRSEQMVDRHFSQFVAAEDQELGARLFEAARRGRAHVREPILGLRADGRTVELSINSKSLMDPAGHLEGVVVVVANLARSHAELLDEVEWRRRITRAVEHDELLVYSQPIVDLRTGRRVQEELLVRMQGIDPDELLVRMQGIDPDELIPPSDFLPKAEQLGLIGDLDRWMMRRAVNLVDRGRVIEVNLSAQSIPDPGLIDDIGAALKQTGADPSNLILEITETAALENVDVAVEFGERLAELGCRLALDDFGIGFGTMKYLKSLSLDFLKIDIEFIRDILDNPASQKVVKTIVQIAREHGQRTIAEGVEGWDTAGLVRSYGVDYAQGNVFGRPVPVREVGQI
jgi:PAS domain S-box-containing protein